MLDEEEVVHPVEPRARTAMLPPVLVSTSCLKPQHQNSNRHYP